MAKKKGKKVKEASKKASADEPVPLASSIRNKSRSVTILSSESLKKVRSKSRSVVFDASRSEIPNRGSQLLEWVRKHMSYMDVDTDSSDEEEVQENVQEKKRKSYQFSETKDDKKATKKKAGQKKGKGQKKSKVEPEEKIIKLNRPSDLEDPITLLIKERKAAKRLAEKLAREEAELTTDLESSVKEEKGKKKNKKKKKDKTKKKVGVSEEEVLKMEKDKAVKAAEMQKKNEEDEIEILRNQQVISQKEQTKRIEDLTTTLEVIKSIQDHSRKMQSKQKKENYWRLYVDCGKLPIVNHIADMTMYLQLWKNVVIDTTPEDAAERTKDVLKLLNVLDNFIDHQPQKSQSRLENYKWLRVSFRAQLNEMIDHMTFKLLRDIDKNMNHINLYTGDFNFKCDDFVLYLWLKFRMPTPLFNPRRAAPPPISLSVKELNMSLDLPPTITGEGMVFRIMYLKYDHLSDTSPGSVKPEIPEYYKFNLVMVMEKEWRVMRKYKVVGRYRAQYEQELQKHENNMQEKANYKPFSMAPPPVDLPPLSKFQLPQIDEDGDIPEVPPTKLDPTPEEYAEAVEECAYNEMRKHLLYIPEEHEINLRKYTILGGLHILNLFYQPPQPQNLVTMVLNVATFVLPKTLTEVPFYEEFKTMPTTGEQKTPEELEAALKLQEDGFAKLISITITLPNHVMYLEPPVVCMWEEEGKKWSTKDIQDVKQNEEKGTVSFRAGRFGVFGLATFRYGNLPYQTWDIRPDEDNNIVFLLTAAVLLFEFKIKGSQITVTQFQNGPNNALKDIVSKSFSINKLARILREGGVDIFPDHDAFCYVEGSCEKHWATEHMCYYTMAQLANCYNFSWSRWNASEDFRSIIMQMRIFNPELHTQKGQSLVLVTPLRAAFINCAEVTPVFCRDPVEGSKFCCNLWYLMRATSTIFVRNKLSEISQDTVQTVAQMLIGTRLLSFS